MSVKSLKRYFSCNTFLIAAVIIFCGGLPALAADPPLSIDLQASSDSGLFNDDDLTNVSTPTIDITAANEGDTINIYRGDVLLGEAVLDSGVLYQYTFTEG